MRNLNECKAEIFRRSEKRIIRQKKNKKLLLTWCIPLCLIIAVWSVTFLPAMMPAGSDMLGNDEEFPDYDGSDLLSEGEAEADNSFGSLSSFEFSLTWDCNGISSYDSETGRLIKTNDATVPSDYTTTYKLTDSQKRQIYSLILSLDVTSYPDKYDPNEALRTSPSMTLILSVKTDILQKTVSAENIALSYEADNARGQRFLSVCEEIKNILTETEEWKALPEYEFFYD